MKLTRIQIDNFQGVRQVDIPLSTAVTLIAGRNFAGKSSIRDGVALAMVGDTSRVNLKKDYKNLVHDGAKAGGVLVTVDDGRTYGVNLPKGATQVSDGLPTGDTVRMALDGQRFAVMKEADRRTFLFAVTGCRLGQDDIKQRLLARKLVPALVEMVMPVLRTGFPSGKDFAADEARKKKGAWQQLTGAHWGDKASEDWKAEKPSVTEPEHSLEDAAALRSEIDGLNTQIGEKQGAQRIQQQARTRRAELQELSKKAPEISGYLKKAEEERDAYEKDLEALRQRAAGGRQIGLVHELAYVLEDIYRTVGAEHLSANANDIATVLDAYELAHGMITPGGAAPDQDAKNRLPEREHGFNVLKNRATNLKRDFDNATAADQLLAELVAQNDLATDYAPDIEALQQRITTLRASLAKMVDGINAAEAAQRKAAAADQLTEQAAKVHGEIKAWLAIADACAPDGIPGEILAEALKPVNSALTASAAFSGWAPVYIDDEMRVTAGSRPYSLLSESEKWRTDAMIAQAVAKLSSLRILVLDRFDVLDLPGRSQAINWLHELADEGHIETALVFGTLKQLPAALPPTFQSFWIEGGVIEQLREAA